MNPRDFLTVADRLKSSTSEAERRTAVGRAYYALYNVLYEALRSQNVPLPQGQQAHQAHRAVVHYLTRCPNRSASGVGMTLNGLRQERNAADYDMGPAVDTNRSKTAYVRASHAVTKFDAERSRILPLLANVPRFTS